MKKRIIVLGSGARQYALAWKISQSEQVDKVYFMPGISVKIDKIESVSIPFTDFEAIADFYVKHNVSYIVTGAGDMLITGIVDFFEERNIKVFGPTKKAAKLEWSKSYAKEFMQKYGIPTTDYKSFNSFEPAKAYLDLRAEKPVVIKADGLVRGRGVFVCKTKSEAYSALKELMQDDLFGDAGSSVVIEEYIEGPEVSLHVISDGETYKIFPLAQDHKPLFEGNRGPNTGGMGTYAPVDWVPDSIHREIEERIIKPTFEGLRAEGIKFRGMLFPGLMLTKYGPMTLEYNTRFGAPETQTFMMLLNSDLDELFQATVDGRLGELNLEWKPGYAATVEAVSANYPAEITSEKQRITFNDNGFCGEYFMSGVEYVNNGFLAVGGKILSSSAYDATSLENALKQAYKGIEAVSFKGMQYRRDIGSLENIIPAREII